MHHGKTNKTNEHPKHSLTGRVGDCATRTMRRNSAWGPSSGAPGRTAGPDDYRMLA